MLYWIDDLLWLVEMSFQDIFNYFLFVDHNHTKAWKYLFNLFAICHWQREDGAHKLDYTQN